MEPALFRILVTAFRGHSAAYLRPKAPRAFTLVEMVVVLAIIVIISAIALLGQNNFNKTLTLTDTAYTVAFSIREAQSLGLSSRVFGDVQNSGYGVHFDNDGTGLNNYFLFADIFPAAPGYNLGGICTGHGVLSTGNPDARPGNCLYNSQQGELAHQYTLNRGFSIARFCGHAVSTNTYYCSKDGQHQLDHMDIVFQRPNTQATIVSTTEGGAVFAMSDALIYIQSPDNITQKCIYVSSLGQISVASQGSANCP